ncbi:MAG: long-chain fatty acid--CoA ligase [Lawsonella sp.]
MKELFAPATYSVGDNESIVDSIYRQQENFPDRILLERPVLGSWHGVTAAEFTDEVVSVAYGLIGNGVKAGDRIALLSQTRYEWLLFAYAIWSIGAVIVPIYPSSSAEQIGGIIEDSGASMIIFENQVNLQTFKGITPPDSIKKIFVIEDAAADKLIATGLEDEENLKKEFQKRRKNSRSSDLACIVFTSGTTGSPKGVEIMHRNMLAEIRSLHATEIAPGTIEPNKRILTFLPLAHVFALLVSVMCVHYGATQAMWSDFKTVVEQFQRFKPHLFIGVPRVYEKVYKGVRRKAHKAGPVGALVFKAASRVAIRYSKALDRLWMPPHLSALHKVFDKLLYRNIREALGGCFVRGVSGGGAMSPDLVHFMRGAGVYVYEGYGLTETSAAVIVNNPGAWRVGSIGRPMDGVGVAIADDGEIMLKGEMLFNGYWKNRSATKKVFKKGWFLTGDLGYIDREGFVFITGRKKDIIVTAGGKNVLPAPLEKDLEESPLISQAVVVGDRRKFISCLISLDQDGVAEWAEKHGKNPKMSIREARRDPDLIEAIEKQLRHTNAMVSRAEGIKKYHILDRELSEDLGEVTATMKVRRHTVEQNFAHVIDRLYSDNRRTTSL